jgi:ketopantoate reductase
MLQDFEDGKPLEIDCLTGAVIEIAELLGVEVPQTRAIDAVVRLKTILRDRASTQGGATPSPEPVPAR